MIGSPIASHRLKVLHWSAFAPTRNQSTAWKAWATSGDLPSSDPCKPDPSHVPAMLRRRLSPMGRAALHTANEVLANDANPFATVYCSQHGEVERTVGLLREISAGGALSPTAFSLSVHNAAVGIHSISSKTMHNITALSAGPDSVCAALMEAYALLSCGPEGGTVLCIVCDDPVPPPFSAHSGHPGSGLASVYTDRAPTELQAISLLVGNTPSQVGTDLQFTLGKNESQLQTSTAMETFLKFLLDPEVASVNIGAEQRLWQWKKLPALD